MSEQVELVTVWRGDLWRESYAPKPAPPIVNARAAVEPRSGPGPAERNRRVLALLARSPRTIEELCLHIETSRRTMEDTMRRLRAIGKVVIVGEAPSKGGRNAALYARAGAETV